MLEFTKYKNGQLVAAMKMKYENRKDPIFLYLRRGELKAT
jgi:hypothetical protein